MNKRINYFIKNAGIFLVGSFGSKFLSFLLLPVYTSILTTQQYGQIDLVSTTQSLIFPLVTLGLSEAIFRFVMMRDIDDDSVLSDAVFMMLGMYVAIFIGSNLINIFLKWAYMPWMLLLLASSMLYDILTNYLKAKQYNKKYVAIGLAYTMINLGCNILFLVVFHFGIEGFLSANILAYLLTSFVILITEKIYSKIRFNFFDLKVAKRMIHYSFPLIFTSLSWWVVTSSDKYMIRLFMTDSDVGVYSIASKIPLILQTVISIFQTVWQISTNDIYDNENKEKLVENFVIFMRMFRQTGFIAGSVLLILTKPIMSLIAKNDFYLGWKYAPFLIISIVFSFATGMVATLYGAYEQNKGVLYSVIVGGSVNIVLNLLLIPYIGVMGATISTAISRLTIALYRLKDTEKLLEFDREYYNVFINGMFIVVQCVLLILDNHWTNMMQAICLFLIVIYNREIIIKGGKYIYNLIVEKKFAK